MARKKEVLEQENDLIRIIMVLLGSIFSASILSLFVLAIIKLQEKNIAQASVFLLLIFIILGLSRFITFVQIRNKYNFWRFVFFLAIDAILGIIIYFGKYNSYLYSLCGGLFCVTIIIARLLDIAAHKTMRRVVFNSIIIILAALLAVGLFIPVKIENNYSPVLVTCFIVTFSALLEILSTSFAQLKVKSLFKIIIRTYALEIFLGLLTAMVGAAIVFMYCEENISTFANGLWYSFSIVTTIGLGDYAATSLIGRIVTVFLGIYGIIVVAVITSIIVNFYNETTGRNDKKKLKDIGKED